MKVKISFKFIQKYFFIAIISSVLIFVVIFLSYKLVSKSIQKVEKENNLINDFDKDVEYSKLHIENLNKIWSLSIPKIDLYNIKIADGTDEKTLERYIGHFENTGFYCGNIGLAAHNRGYNINYFERLKELDIGDKVQYMYGENKLEYEVNIKKEISSYDWSYLENTSDNRITLITCVENHPELRLCVQALRVN